MSATDSAQGRDAATPLKGASRKTVTASVHERSIHQRSLSLATFLTTIFFAVAPHLLVTLKIAAIAAKGVKQFNPVDNIYRGCVETCLGDSATTSPVANVLLCFRRLPVTWAQLFVMAFTSGLPAGPSFDMALIAAVTPAAYIAAMLAIVVANRCRVQRALRSTAALNVHAAYAVVTAILVANPWSWLLQRMLNRPHDKPSVAFAVLNAQHGPPSGRVANLLGIVVVLFPFFGQLHGHRAAVFWMCVVIGRALFTVSTCLEAKYYLSTAPHLLAGSVHSEEGLAYFFLQQLMLASAAVLACLACDHVAQRLQKPAPAACHLPGSTVHAALLAGAPSSSTSRAALREASEPTNAYVSEAHDVIVSEADDQERARAANFASVLSGVSVSVLQGKVHLCLPHLDPNDLPHDWQERLQEQLKARFPRLRLRSAAVWQGSLHIVLECCGVWDEDDTDAACELEAGVKLVAEAALIAATIQGHATGHDEGVKEAHPHKPVSMTMEVGKTGGSKYAWSVEQHAWTPAALPATTQGMHAPLGLLTPVLKCSPLVLLPITPRVFAMDSVHVGRTLSSRRRHCHAAFDGTATTDISNASLCLQLLCPGAAYPTLSGMTCVARWDAAGCISRSADVPASVALDAMRVQVFKGMQAYLRSMGPLVLASSSAAPADTVTEVVLELPLESSMTPAFAALLTVELYGPDDTTMPLATTTLLHLQQDVVEELAELVVQPPITAAFQLQRANMACGALDRAAVPTKVPSLKEAAAAMHGHENHAWLDVLVSTMEELDGSVLLRMAGHGSVSAMHASELAQGVGKAMGAIQCCKRVLDTHGRDISPDGTGCMLGAMPQGLDVPLFYALVAEGVGQCMRYGAWETTCFLLEALKRYVQDLQPAVSCAEVRSPGAVADAPPFRCARATAAGDVGLAAVMRLLDMRVEVVRDGCSGDAAGGAAAPAPTVVLPLALLPVEFGQQSLVLCLEAWLESQGGSYSWARTHRVARTAKGDAAPSLQRSSPLSRAFQSGQAAWAARAATASWLRWPSGSMAGRVADMQQVRQLNELLVHVRCYFAAIISVVSVLYAVRELWAGDVRTMLSFILWPPFFYTQAWLSLRYGAAGKAWLVRHAPGMHVLAAINRCACMVAVWPLKLITPVDTQALGRFYCDLRYTPAEVILEPLLSHALEPVPAAVTPWLLLGDVLGRMCLHVGIRAMAVDGLGGVQAYPLAVCVARSLTVSASAGIARWAVRSIAQLVWRPPPALVALSEEPVVKACSDPLDGAVREQPTGASHPPHAKIE